MVKSEANSPALDAVLRSYLEEADEAQADRLLAELLAQHARPLVIKIIRSTIRFSASSGIGQLADLDDIYSEAVLALLVRLRRLKANQIWREGPGFRNYVSVTAYNCCYNYLRRKYPNRCRLKDRLEYLFRHRAGLAIWRPESGERVYGYESWRDQQREPAEPSRLMDIAGDSGVAAAIRQHGVSEALDLSVQVILDAAGGPVEPEELLRLIVELWGITDRSSPVEMGDVDSCGFYDQGGRFDLSRQDAVSEAKIKLVHVWQEILELPVSQRRALLVSLKDGGGRDAVTLLANARIASLRQIAKALEMDPDEFSEILSHLPLTDSAIAKLLGLTRQQVINLRKSARERLIRRLRSVWKSGENS